jgi:hypothetical protein
MRGSFLLCSLCVALAPLLARNEYELCGSFAGRQKITTWLKQSLFAEAHARFVSLVFSVPGACAAFST